MMHKRGVSTIIAALLMIVFVLVASGILWGVIRGTLSETEEDIAFSAKRLLLTIKEAKVTAGGLDVEVARDIGEGKLAEIKFIITDEQGNTELQDHNASGLGELESKTFHLNYSGSAVSVEIAPILMSGGDKRVGNVVDKTENIEKLSESYASIKDITLTQGGVQVEFSISLGDFSWDSIQFIVNGSLGEQTFTEAFTINESGTQMFELAYVGEIYSIEAFSVIGSNIASVSKKTTIESGEYCRDIFDKNFGNGKYYLNPNGESRVRFYCNEDIDADNLITNWEFIGGASVLSSDWSDLPELIDFTSGPLNQETPVHNSKETTSTECYDWAKTQLIAIDPLKSYEFSIRIRSTDTLMNNYFGFYVYDSSETRIEGDWDNPYFKSSEGDPDSWVEWTANLGSSADGSAEQCDTSGTNGNDWCLSPDAAYVIMRFGSCAGDGDASGQSYFAYPKIKEI